MMKIMAADWKLWLDTHSNEDNGCKLEGYGWKQHSDEDNGCRLEGYGWTHTQPA